MRKFLLVLLIIALVVLMFFVVWQDIPNLSLITTYQEIEEAYGEYQKTLRTLETKNNVELPNTLAKLDVEYSATDTDNVIKKYNDNKSNYEELLAYQQANAAIGAADIYDIEYIWTNVGGYAANNWCNMTMDLTKSEADLESEDYVMCNLEFEVVGLYSCVTQFIKDIEMDSNIGFQINDFFIEGYNSSSRNQNKDVSMDTDNIPSEEETEEIPVYSNTSSDSVVDRHLLDIKASFKVYNVPINRRTITNVKSATDISTTLLEDSEDNVDNVVQ